MHAPFNRTLNYVWHELLILKLQREMCEPLSLSETSIPLYQISTDLRGRKITKDIDEFNTTINQLYIIDIYRIFHPEISAYTFFSSSWETATEKDDILSHKTDLNKFKRIKIIKCLLSEHNGIKLEINNRKISGKSQSTWKLYTSKQHMAQKRNLKKDNILN